MGPIINLIFHWKKKYGRSKGLFTAYVFCLSPMMYIPCNKCIVISPPLGLLNWTTYPHCFIDYYPTLWKRYLYPLFFASSISILNNYGLDTSREHEAGIVRHTPVCRKSVFAKEARLVFFEHKIELSWRLRYIKVEWWCKEYLSLLLTGIRIFLCQRICRRNEKMLIVVAW